MFVGICIKFVVFVVGMSHRLRSFRNSLNFILFRWWLFVRLENGRLSLWSMPKHGLKFEQPSFFDLFQKKVIIFVRFAGSLNKVKKNYLRACQHVIKEIHFWCFFFLFNFLSWFLADFITQCWVSMQFFGRGAKQMIEKYPKFKIKEETNWISNIWKYEMTSCESENRHELVFRHYLNVQKSCVIISRPWASCARRKTKKVIMLIKQKIQK